MSQAKAAAEEEAAAAAAQSKSKHGLSRQREASVGARLSTPKKVHTPEHLQTRRAGRVTGSGSKRREQRQCSARLSVAVSSPA